MIRLEVSCFRHQSRTGANSFSNNRPLKDFSNIEIILYENSLRLIRRVNEDFDENNSGRMFNSYNPLYSKIFKYSIRYNAQRPRVWAVALTKRFVVELPQGNQENEPSQTRCQQWLIHAVGNSYLWNLKYIKIRHTTACISHCWQRVCEG